MSDWWDRVLSAPGQRGHVPDRAPAARPYNAPAPAVAVPASDVVLAADGSNVAEAAATWSGTAAAQAEQPCPQCRTGTLYSRAVSESGMPYRVPPSPQCFAAETEVLTRDGVFSIKELAGYQASLLTSATDVGGPAKWVTAPVKSFGEQRLWMVTLSRNGIRKGIRATEGHRWLVRVSEVGGRRTVSRETRELRVGHRLAFASPQSVLPQVVLSAAGVAHGVVFGDGSVTSSGGSRVTLWGVKRTLLRFFAEPNVREENRPDVAVDGVEVSALPAYYKALPSLGESASYLAGWLAGMLATDGHVSCATGEVSLANKDQAVLLFVRDVCTRLGVVTFAPRCQRRLGKGSVESDIWKMTLDTQTLHANLFVRPEQRAACVAADRKFRRVGWQVVDVQPTDDVEEVFCAVVPDTNTFTLADNILVGNCYECGFPLVQAGSMTGPASGVSPTGTKAARQLPTDHVVESGGVQFPPPKAR